MTAPKKSTAAEKPSELDEAKINAPSIADLVMLSVICISTLIMWAAGRAACNYHVPGESLTPRKVTLEERTRTPKDVGVEFAQSLGGGDFDVAAKLAVGDAVEFVRKEKTACAACSDRKKAAEKLLSVATVLEANSVDSIVSVRTKGGPEGEQVRILGIERKERDWRVSRVYSTREEAQLVEAPEREDVPASIRRPEDEGAATADTGATPPPGATPESSQTSEK